MTKKFFKINSEGKIVKLELNKRSDKKDNNFFYLKYFNIGFYLIFPLLISVLIGIYLKRVVFFIFLGTIFTFYNLIKITKE